MSTHLWWNGYDHSYGATEEEAVANYMKATGCTADEAEGDGWVQVEDDQQIYDEGVRDDGEPQATGETARQYAEAMARIDAAPAQEEPRRG